MILFSPAPAGRWRLDPGSVEVVTAFEDQLRNDGTPKRFDLEAREGVSDHLPSVVSLELRP